MGWLLPDYLGEYLRRRDLTRGVTEPEEAAHRDPDEPWPVYDIADLGLTPHPRETCAACQAVGT
jgi:hypothetical protein